MSEKGLSEIEGSALVGRWVIQVELLKKEIAQRDEQIEQLRAELSEARKGNEKEP